jgi:resuscitation-promoting factor RpfA
VRHSTFASRFAAGALTIGLVISGVATAAPAGASQAMQSKLHKLRVCESGNNYQENTGNGYFGAYQFSRSTWHGLGFHGRPDQAKHVTQDRAAKRLHHQSGWGAWPSCARTEHLRR